MFISLVGSVKSVNPVCQSIFESNDLEKETSILCSLLGKDIKEWMILKYIDDDTTRIPLKLGIFCV